MPFRAEEKQKQKKGKREYNAHWENLFQKWGKNNKFLVTRLWQKATFLGKSRRNRLKKENVAWGINLPSEPRDRKYFNFSHFWKQNSYVQWHYLTATPRKL